MARFLQKAARGAATAGAQLSMEQHRANMEQQRQERLNQYQTERQGADQTYRTGEREAAQGFTAEQNRLDREARASLEGQKAAAKGNEGKVPEYQKYFSRKSAEAIGGQLREDGSFRFESQDDATRAALLENTAINIYLSQPEDQRREDVAYSKALKIVRAHDAQPSDTELDMELDAEAKKRKGWFSDDFGGLSEQDWRAQQKKNRLAESQGLISSAMRDAGLETPRAQSAQPAVMQGMAGDYTQEDLEFTAQQHGITVEEVKKRLGIH